MSYFDGGEAFADLADLATAMAGDICGFPPEIGDTTGRVPLTYVNPSITRALDARGLDIVNGVQVSDAACVI